jgi:hypothetical protein
MRVWDIEAGRLADPHRQGRTALSLLLSVSRKGSERMQCYFYSEVFVRPGQPTTAGVVSFKIPDLDIVFRAQFKGSPQECQYAALLALLEFVDLNPQLFKHKTLELYSDSIMVVSQVNSLQVTTPKDLEPYRNMALTYRRKFPYNLNLIRRANNPAQREIPYTDA